jgi:hypothetical protein
MVDYSLFSEEAITLKSELDLEKNGFRELKQ